MKRKLAVLLILILILLTACRKPPAPPAPVPVPAPFSTPATAPDITDPLPPVATPPEVPELTPPAPSEPEPVPEPVSEPAPEPVATQAEPDFGIPINETIPGAPPPEETKPELNTAKIELELLLLINGLREESGAEPLGLQEEMQYAARIRSAEALERFSHTRPDETPYNTAFDEAGFSYAGKWHGENLASLSFKAGQLDESESALKLFDGLSASDGHRENMARGYFAQAGVGVAYYMEDETVTLASAQLFASF